MHFDLDRGRLKPGELPGKRTLVVISDTILAPSGVATQSRYLIEGLARTGRYRILQLGGALKHASDRWVRPHPDVTIVPVNGYGDQATIRRVLLDLNPDALILFTDPRFFEHVWAMEDEIRQTCPIAYWTIWDDSGSHPPTFNRRIYERCDLLNCINWPTYACLREMFPDRTNYVPHAVPKDLYHPLADIERDRLRTQLLGERASWFTAMYVGRNARRKRVADTMHAWRLFLDRLQTKHGHQRATLLIHSDPQDPEGPDLMLVGDRFGLRDNVVFSTRAFDLASMNQLYNLADVVVNNSCAEGFGLPILEAKMAGVPVIAPKTGGLARQVRCHLTGEEFGAALDPDVSTIISSRNAPLIAEDYVSDARLADAFMRLFETPAAERRSLGLRARQHAIREYDIDRMIGDWDRSLSDVIDRWKGRTRWTVTSL